MNKSLLKNIFFSVILLLPLMENHLLAQKNSNLYPLLKPSNFLTKTHAINRLEKDQQASINVLHQRYLNLFSDVYLVNLSGFVKIKSNSQLGILATSSKEGPYINKSSLGIHFASGINITKNAHLSAGVMAGLNSLSYDDSNTGSNSGGSANAPDLSIDISLNHQNYFFYYSYNQLLSILLKPLNTPIQLKKFQEARIGFKFKLGRKSNLSPQMHCVLYENKPMVLGGNLNLTTHSLISLGIGNYNFNTMVYQLAIQIPETNNWTTSITGSYNQLIGNKEYSLYNNTFEIGLLLSKKDNKVEEVVHDSED